MAISDPLASQFLDKNCSDKPFISIVICTQNRSHLLSKTIKSLLAQDFPAKGYEIIIVDNASTDNTRDVVLDFRALTEIPIRYAYEDRLGVSFARNTGLGMAQGDLLAYIDDDEQAAPGWIQGIVESFESVYPQPGIVCGPVKPDWESEPPGWLVDQFFSYLSIMVLPPQPTFLAESGWSFPEGNSAFRTDILRALGGFDTSVGRRGNSLLAGEADEIERKIRSMGLSIYYHPPMSVDHFIPNDRLTVGWLTKRAFFQGVTDAIQYIQGNHLYGLSRYRILALNAVRLIRFSLHIGLERIMVFLRKPSNSSMVKYVSRRLDFSRRLGWLAGFYKYSLST